MLKNFIIFARFAVRYLKVISFTNFLFASILFSDLKEDIDKINNISDLESCYCTFQSILEKAKEESDYNSFINAQPAISSVTSSIEYWRQNPQDLQHVAWDLYPKFAKAYALSHGFNIPLNESFTKLGFRQGIVDQELNSALIDAFQSVKKIPFIEEDHDPNYSFTPGLGNGQNLNKNHTYLMLEDLQKKALLPILESLKQEIAECIGMPWKCVTVRAWKTDSEATDYGPNDWHTDGLPLSVWKLMIYPKGASYEKGTTELKVENSTLALDGGPGTWLFFKNSEVIHRGVAPKEGTRLIIEATIIPALDYDVQPIVSGQNSRHPLFPWTTPYLSSHPNYQRNEVIAINIGGGPNWSCPGWVNLEEVTSATNPHSFLLFPNCRFPMENNSIKSVYSSHAIEHLNIPTVYRILSESHRVLEKGGNLIIKIPDYDKALDCWQRQDPSFFELGWNIASITHLWGKNGICDCIDHRAAMIFCSFFNDAYGNPFASNGSSNTAQAYFGPPILDVHSLRNLISGKSPSEVAEELRNHIYSKETNFRFCHQSAWSRQELESLLKEFNFEVITFDPNVIVNTFGAIPGMHEMREMSTYCWAKKK
ncbi:MAG: hypothetical protein COT84_06435 [Chlamydiae bacterium CG10_big_fil_rev_8_21_14_0_10_35_9]|nr:MAG: hypothetical protein COT84_06435 [Chlamydiae bacterium CG10_big_fil_rev_8_21_14_0_10_35_9]